MGSVLKIGDRVRQINVDKYVYPHIKLLGKVGTVVHVTQEGWYSVNFDTPIPTSDRTIFVISGDVLELIDEEVKEQANYDQVKDWGLF